MPTPYPAAVPTVSGTTISVDAFLQNPPRVQRTITQLTLQRFLADRIFTAGPRAEGGAVLFDQLTASDFFTARDVQAIEPLSEFPILNSGETMPLVVGVVKWGGAALFSYESVRRDRRDLLNRELIRLRNTIVRKVDTVAMAALNAAPVQTMAASASWGTVTTDVIGDLASARSMIDNADMGYVADTVILHPTQALGIRKNTNLRTALPRENLNTNLLSAPDLNGLLGFPNWYVSNRATAGTVWVLASGQVGSISDELPLYSRVVDEQTREAYRVMAARVAVPYVTDPMAAVKITGA